MVLVGRGRFQDQVAGKKKNFAERWLFCLQHTALVAGDTVDGRNPAPPGMYEPL